MASCSVVKILCLVVLAMVVTSPVTQAAITCGQVSSAVAPCLNYLKVGGVVPAACCNSVRSLNSATKTTADRQAACKCLQSAASSIKGLNLNFASALPGKCGINVPYKISPSTNCNSVK
ncbi:non-specific lipid-transfer protein 1-like [Humulus lupulus]|uniref:non-specific lipid-transfer protein 1-like n=1 Tax=Humulus lupulus TaxID=3486 RepID=UPI002B40B017|nr:non-specific lipid-transfer protein 1-like [Humulus lupulus]